MDHGVIATASREPLMNANDHVPMVHILPFGLCKKGMPCMPLTPVAWVDVNKKHIIDGAPALTEDSKLACFHGGVISIVPLDAGSAEEGDRNEIVEGVVEEIASAALSILGSIAAKRIPFMKKLVKMRGKKKSVKGGGSKDKGSGSNGGENSGATSNRSLDRSGNSGGESKKVESSNIGDLSRAQRVNLERLNNIVDEHLTDMDFSGTLRDLQGNPVPKRGGGYWNHLQEMKDSYGGLLKIRRGLEGSLKNPNLSPEARKALQDGLDKANSNIRKIEELFEPYGGI